MKKNITWKYLNIWIIFCLIFLLNASAGIAADTTLTWDPPTLNEDGSALEDLDGYILYFGTASDTYTQSIDVNNVTTYELTGLTIGATYYFAMTAYDTSGNESTYSNELIRTIQAPADTTPPAISSIQASGLTESSATVSWSTNEGANTQVEYGTSNSYGTSTALNSSLTTSHSQDISGLSASTLYHYRVLSRDAAGNLTSSSDYTFTTSETPDITAPVISSVQTSGISESSAAISWSTNEAADTKIEYGTSISYGTSTTLNSTLGTSHSQSISGLSASTLYHYRVLSRDEAGNLASSNDYTFTTSEEPQFDYYCDSDSDGFIDNSVSGTCTGTGCKPAECATTAGNDCDDSNPNINPDAVDDTCDGVDDNCSGTPDNNYVITVTSCGSGVCSSVGQLECLNGVESDSCSPGTPTEDEEATCDDLDNDCDGQVDEGCAPVIKVSSVLISEDFSAGIPDTWSAQGTWNTDNTCGKTIEYPFEGSAAIVDSSCAATSNDSLVTKSFDTLSCSSLDLTFTNQYYWYSGSMEIDVSDNGGATWSNNLYIDADAGYPTPQWKDVDISAITDSTDAQVKFKYINNASNGFWAIDNVWVTCQSSQVEFESTILTSAIRTIMITNSGNEDLAVGEISMSGTDASDFILNENNSCSNQTLSPTETCTFDVEFSSSSLGSRSADITVSSNDPANPVSTLSLSGTVVNPPVPQIMINGSSGHVEVLSGENISIAVELDPSDLNGKKADWWVQYEYRNRSYYYDASIGKWRRGTQVYNQAELSSTGSIDISSDSRLPRGFYTYSFGVDTEMNGSLDSNLYFEDSVTVEVK